MRVAKVAVVLLALLACALPLCAQMGSRDPLTEKESDQLREAAQEPDKRLKLLVSFVRARMTTLEELRASPKATADRGQQVHDLLEDFTSLVDEVDDNVDDYSDKHWDMRDGLKEVIKADTEFQAKLKALKESSGNAEGAQYSFVLQNAIEAVDSSLDNARQAMKEQEELFSKKKKDKEK
jgi:hypothetical protein